MDIRHQPSHSGGWITFCGPAPMSLDSAKSVLSAPEPCDRSARNFVASCVSVYELTMRNWTPISKITRPRKKYWLRLNSIIAQLCRECPGRTRACRRSIKTTVESCAVLISSRHEIGCRPLDELPMREV